MPLADGMITSCRTGNYNITNLGAILFAKRLSDFPSLGAKIYQSNKKYNSNNKMSASREHVVNKGYANGFEGLITYINSIVPHNETMVKH